MQVSVPKVLRVVLVRDCSMSCGEAILRAKGMALLPSFFGA